MATYKQNMGTLRACLGIEEIVALLTAHGMPEDQACGIADVDEMASSVVAMLSITGQVTVKKMDKATKTKKAVTVAKDDLFLFRITPAPGPDKMGILEVYDGGAKSAETVGKFLYGDLKSDIIFEAIDQDPIAVFNKLLVMVPDASLRSARLAGYKHDESTVGPYSPRFASSGVAIDFLEDLLEKPEAEEAEDGDEEKVVSTKLKSIQAEWERGGKKIKLTINPNASFRFTCKEDVEEYTREVIRYLVGAPKLCSGSIDSLLPAETTPAAAE